MQAKPASSLKSYKLLKLLGRSYVLEDQLAGFMKFRRNKTEVTGKDKKRAR